MRVLGVDYGERRVGLALVDAGATLALPRGLGTVECHTRRQTLETVRDLALREGVTHVVVGVPLAPDGGAGLRGRQAQNFGRDLAVVTGLVVWWQDERDSSLEAAERLRDAGLSRDRRARLVDEMAAIIILERFLSEQAERTARGEGPPGEYQENDTSTGKMSP